MLTQLVMDAEVTAQIGAAHGERVPERRLTQRNGYRERRWDTRVGTIDLQIPKLRDGTYFPSLLEPRRRAERALLAVVQEAYVGGVSTRRVEELVGALGIVNLSRSEVSRICAGLDAEVDAFRSRPLDPAGHPYVSLDALYHKVREGGRVVSMATLNRPDFDGDSTAWRKMESWQSTAPARSSGDTRPSSGSGPSGWSSRRAASGVSASAR